MRVGDLTARMRSLGARDTGQAVIAAPEFELPSDEEVQKARGELAAAGRPVLLAAGRLAEQKDFGVLLEAAAAWQHRDQVPVLAIAGDGPLAGELSARAAADRLEVVFLGPRSDIPALLAAADVVVVPSRWEARALIVQEALRLGRPIVATRVGGIPDLTGDDGALLVPPGDPGQLAAAVLAVLDDQAWRPGSLHLPGPGQMRSHRRLRRSRRRSAITRGSPPGQPGQAEED